MVLDIMPQKMNLTLPCLKTLSLIVTSIAEYSQSTWMTCPPLKDITATNVSIALSCAINIPFLTRNNYSIPSSVRSLRLLWCASHQILRNISRHERAMYLQVVAIRANKSIQPIPQFGTGPATSCTLYGATFLCSGLHQPHRQDKG